MAALIVFLALRLLVRWRHGYFDLHAHVHEDEHHRHPVRTPVGAFGIGLVHGMGGSAGVGVLILAAIPSTAVACVALVVLAALHRGLDDDRHDGLRAHALVAPGRSAPSTASRPFVGAVQPRVRRSGTRVAAWGLVAYPL